MMVSVVSVPVAVSVCALVQVAELIAPVARAFAPLAIVVVQVAQAIVPVVVIGPPVIGLVVAMFVTVPFPVIAVQEVSQFVAIAGST